MKEPEYKDPRGGYRERAGQKQRQQAHRHILTALPLIRAYIKMRYSLTYIARQLNNHGYRTQTGKLYTKTQVHRIIQREKLAA